MFHNNLCSTSSVGEETSACILLVKCIINVLWLDIWHQGELDIVVCSRVKCFLLFVPVIGNISSKINFPLSAIISAFNISIILAFQSSIETFICLKLSQFDRSDDVYSWCLSSVGSVNMISLWDESKTQGETLHMIPISYTPHHHLLQFNV